MTNILENEITEFELTEKQEMVLESFGVQKENVKKEIS